MKILEQQDTGTCTKTLKIEVPTDEIDKELEGVYKEFMENAIVPGFRKGKAPRYIVKMKYGKHLGLEARGKAVETAFEKAAEELGLKPVTAPEFPDFDKEKKESDEPIVFEAKFEYIPKVELAEYKDIRPELPASEVTEKEVVETLTRLRENSAMFATIDDRSSQEGDFVTIASKATIDDQPFAEATHNDISMELGSKRYIPGLEDALINLKPGDSKSVTLTLPEDYPIEDKRGKEIHFEIELKEIREKRLPELDDEFAKDMGNFNSLDALKERIREDLGRNVEERQKQQLRQAIRQELMQRNPFAVPPSMIRARYNYINAVHDMELRRYGSSLEEEARRDEGLLARNEKTAEEEVRVSLILDNIAEKETIEVNDQDYMEYIARLAQRAGSDPATYTKRIESQGLETFYRREALEEKVLDYLQDLAELSVSQSKQEPSAE